MARKINVSQEPIRRPKRRSSLSRRQLTVGLHFYDHLLKIFLATVLICAAGLGYLYFWLYRYERQSVTGALTRYLQDVDQRKWDDIYQIDSKYFTELNTKENLVTYLLYVYGETKASGFTFTLASIGENDWRYYDAYYRQTKISTLETYKPDDSSTWKVRTIVSGGTYTFDVLDGSTFKINDIPITSAYTDGTDPIPLAYAKINERHHFPTVTRYTVENLVRPPVPQPERADTDMFIRDYSANHYYIGPKPTQEQYEIFARELENTAIAYSKYITKDGTFYNLNVHLFPGTEFYSAISSLDNQYFSTHDTIDFQNIQVTDVMPIGDEAFAGTIAYDVVVTAGGNTKTYRSLYQIFFIRSNSGDWKATNIITLAQDGNEADE